MTQIREASNLYAAAFSEFYQKEKEIEAIRAKAIAERDAGEKDMAMYKEQFYKKPKIQKSNIASRL